MDAIYLVIESLVESECSYGKHYGGEEKKTVIEIFQEEEQALQFLKSLKSLSKTTKTDGGEEYRSLAHYIQKVSKHMVLAVQGESDQWYLFP